MNYHRDEEEERKDEVKQIAKNRDIVVIFFIIPNLNLMESRP